MSPSCSSGKFRWPIITPANGQLFHVRRNLRSSPNILTYFQCYTCRLGSIPIGLARAALNPLIIMEIAAVGKTNCCLQSPGKFAFTRSGRKLSGQQVFRIDHINRAPGFPAAAAEDPRHRPRRLSRLPGLLARCPIDFRGRLPEKKFDRQGRTIMAIKAFPGFYPEVLNFNLHFMKTCNYVGSQAARRTV